MNKKNFSKGFTMVEIIISLTLLVLVSTISILAMKKIEKNTTLSTEIPNIVKDSISVYAEKYKEQINYNEYCNEKENFNCSYVTYKELIDYGLIDEKVDNGYDVDSCFKLSKTDEGLINMVVECKSDDPVIVLKQSSDNIKIGESKKLKEYIKNVNPSNGTLTITINNDKKDLEYDISSLGSGVYNIVFSIKNKNNKSATKKLVLTVTATIEDVIKSKISGCIKNEDGYDEDLCAFKGSDPNNYFWYSGFTWRIIGINKDGTIKIVTQNPVGLLSWGVYKTSYEESYARKWLNELDSSDNYDGIFYNVLDNPTKYLNKSYWDISNNPTKFLYSSSDMGDNSEEITLSSFSDYIGMITVREYKRASNDATDVSKENYLNIKSEYMTMTLIGRNKDDIFVKNIDSDGNIVIRTQVHGYQSGNYKGIEFRGPVGIRPVVNLKNDLSISGDGTFSNPYKIVDEKSGEKNTSLNKRYAGEYVTFSGLTWRIMKINENKTTIILNDFMKENNNYVKKSYSENKVENNNENSKYQKARYNIEDSLNIGYYLNHTFYDSLNQKNWIVDAMFPNSRFGAGSISGTARFNDYEAALTKVADKKIYLYNKYYTTFYYTPVKAKIGLSSIGQLFSGDDIRVRNVCYSDDDGKSDCYKATMTQDEYYINSSLMAQGYDGTASNVTPYTNKFIYRPITTLKESIKINGGSGTLSDPYILKD